MEYVRKHLMIPLLLFVIVSFLFTFVVFRESISIKIEEFRFQERINGETGKQVLYNYHRAGEREAEMTQFNDVPFETDDEKDVQRPDKSFIYHRVQQGETLWKIAQRYNVSVDNIVVQNGIENPDLIYSGSILKIISDS